MDVEDSSSVFAPAASHAAVLVHVPDPVQAQHKLQYHLKLQPCLRLLRFRFLLHLHLIPRLPAVMLLSLPRLC